jgi:hypothetical protein
VDRFRLGLDEDTFAETSREPSQPGSLACQLLPLVLVLHNCVALIKGMADFEVESEKEKEKDEKRKLNKEIKEIIAQMGKESVTYNI